MRMGGAFSGIGGLELAWRELGHEVAVNVVRWLLSRVVDVERRGVA